MLSSGRRVLLAVAVLAVIVVVGVAGWWFFIRDDAPPRAALGESDSASANADITVDDVQGTWTVATGNGSPQEGTGTFAGYRIGEELASIGGQTAVGRTGDVSGDIVVDSEQVTEATFEVNMATLESDESRRDDRLKTQGLETDTFTTATFTLTQPIDIPADARGGQDLTFTAVGDLDLHGVTQQVQIDLQARLAGEEIVLAGSAPIVLADYDIEKPTGGFIVSIEDQGEFEFRLVLTQDGGAGSGSDSGGATETTESTESSETTETTDGY
jgi:polyisoprenoid-binding protein YceI